MAYTNINNTPYCVPILTDDIIYREVGLDSFKVNSFNDYDYVYINFSGTTIPSTTISFPITGSSISNIDGIQNPSLLYNNSVFENNDDFEIQQITNTQLLLKSKKSKITIGPLSASTSAITFVDNSFTAKTEYNKTYKLDIFATTNPSVKNRISAGYKFTDGIGNFSGNSLNKITSLRSIFNYNNEDDYIRFNMSSIYNTFFNNNILNGNNISLKWEPLNSVVMKVNESIDNILSTKENDFNTNTFNNIFNLLNARNSNNQYNYNNNLEINFNQLNSAPSDTISNLHMFSFNRNISNGNSFYLEIDPLIGIIFTFSNSITESYTIVGDSDVGYEVNIRIDKDFYSTMNNFQNAFGFALDTAGYYYQFEYQSNTFNTGLFIISSFLFIDNYSESNFQIQNLLNETVKINNNFYIASNIMDYNNNIKLNNNGVGFIRTREYTPVVTTMLNSFPSTAYTINEVNQILLQMQYIGNGVTQYYKLENNDTGVPSTSSEDYIYLINNNFTSSNILNIKLINTISKDSNKYLLSYLQNINCENFYDKNIFTLGWRNKFGTIGFISTISKPIINVARDVSFNRTNKQYSTNSFINSPNTSTSLNKFIRREINSYNSSISFTLTFPFNNDTKEIATDIIDSNYFCLYDKIEGTFNLSIDSYSFENNILSLTLSYLDNDINKDKLLLILNKF